MKTPALCATAFVTFLAAACGGGGLKPGIDGGADLSVPDMMSKPPDLSFITIGVNLAGIDFTGVACGNQTCGTGESCCVVPDGQGLSQMCISGDHCSGDGGGGVDAACDGPEDCQGTNTCCANIALGGDTPSGGAMCTASCSASVTEGGGGMLTTRLCHSSADCTNLSGATPLGTLDFDSCCSYTGVSYNFCAPGLLAAQTTAVHCQP